MVCKDAMAIMFADETKFFLSNSYIGYLQDLVNEEFSHLAAWLKIDKLSLNRIGNKLTSNEHINYMSGKIARGIGIITKARTYLKQKTLTESLLFFYLPI